MIFDVSKKFIVLMLLIYCGYVHADKDPFSDYDKARKDTTRLKTLICQPYPKQKHQNWTWDGKILRVDGINISGGELEWIKKKDKLVFVIQTATGDEYFADMFIDFDDQRMDIPNYGITVRCYGY